MTKAQKFVGEKYAAEMLRALDAAADIVREHLDGINHQTIGEYLDGLASDLSDQMISPEEAIEMLDEASDKFRAVLLALTMPAVEWERAYQAWAAVQ
jgi:hypothetical protein